jgi:cellulose synthase/poly-beta-1,6-N-acetylglucosamine synthase-like glycosyltransferase
VGARLRTVVVAWGGSPRLEAALDAIEVAGRPFAGEIVVVARPGDPAAARESGRALVRESEEGQPNTPGAHRNQGARGADAPFLLFADDDVVVERDFVAEAIARLEGDPAVAGVGGRIHERQWEGGRLVREVPDLHRSGAGGDVEMHAAAGIARRSAFEAGGGFDPRLPAEEDMELCLRLAQAGGRIVALDTRAAYHDCAPRPSLAEIERRFRGGLFAGQGLLLRHSWGTPQFARHLARQRLYLATLAYALLGAALFLVALVAPNVWRLFTFWTLGALYAWALMAWRKKSVALGGLSILTWLALGAGIARAWATGDARSPR